MVLAAANVEEEIVELNKARAKATADPLRG
jgi:hypothetical protein